jgi:hypothetical protein
VTVHATGIVKETGKKFWSTKDEGQQPFTYQAGVGKVIVGWDQGCLGMQIGECMWGSVCVRSCLLVCACWLVVFSATPGLPLD